MNNSPHDPITRWLAAVSCLLLVLIFAALVTSAVRGPSTRERITSIERQLTYVSCLLLIEPPDRTPEVVADCQVGPEETP